MLNLVIALTLLTASVISFQQQVAAVPILDIDSNGQLLGASNLQVSGNSYDVKFLDGSYLSLFDIGGYTFHTREEAIAASTELSTFFLPVFQSQYPNSVNGLSTVGTGWQYGAIYTPYAINNWLVIVSSVTKRAWNDFVPPMQDLVLDNNSDGVSTTSIFSTEDTFFDPRSVYAVWTPSPVPEPSTMILLGTGLFGLVVCRRKVKK